MKNKILCVIIAVVCLCFAVACSTPNYTVSFNVEGGSLVSAQTVEEGKTAKKPEDPIKEGYNFLGWFVGESEYDFASTVTADITLTAKWQILTFSVSFNTDGAGEITAQTVEYKGVAEKPEDPKKEGWKFLGWFVGDSEYDFSSPVTSNLTLTAKWQDSSVNVVYHYADGTSESVRQKVGTLFENKDHTVQNGLVFDGWYTQNGEPLNEQTAVNEELEVYASVYTSGLVFEDNAVSGYTGSETCVVIPNYANGKKITVIKERAFYESQITEIKFSANIEKIEEYAFGSCLSLEKVEFTSGLKVLKQGAFFDCPKIIKIEIPESVTEIGYGAFAQKLYLFELVGGEKAVMPDTCALEEITLPFVGGSPGYSDVSYFAYIFGAYEPTLNGYSVEGIDVQFGENVYKVNLYSALPSSLKKVTLKNAEVIPDYAFYNCMYLESVTVASENIFSIGKSAFEGCFSADINGVEVAEYISERAFMGSGFKGAQFSMLVEVGDMAFANTLLEEFIIPETLESIGSAVFANTAITEIRIPKNVRTIGDMAFYSCNYLNTVYFESETPCEMGSTLFTVVEDGVAYYSNVVIYVPNGSGDTKPYEEYRKDLYLRDYASGIFPISYEGQTGYITEGELLLGYVAKEGEKLVDITLPVGVKEIADFAFYNLASVKSLTAPEGFEKIGKYVFYNCTSFQYLNMPSTMKEIDDYAFAGFFVGNNLSRLYFPEGFKRIGDGAFLSSFNLKIVDIPSSIEYLGYLSFGMSNSLERMYIRATNPPEHGFYDNGVEEVDNNIFSIVNSAKTIIYVPAGNETQGENAGKSYADIYKEHLAFKDFATYIKAIPEGKEVGHYGNGEIFIDLDGCNQAVIYTIGEIEGEKEEFERFEYKKEYGTYSIAGAMLNLSFETYGEIKAIYANRTIRYNLGGNDYVLSEPKHYYDTFNWANFMLYETENGGGKGVFDMYGYYLTPFDWIIEGSVFKLYMDCNNVLPEHAEFAGVKEYIGTYNKATDEFSVSFMMNDYDVEIMTYTAGYIPSVYATAKEEKLYGTYKVYAENNPDFAMFTLLSYANGVVDVYIGESVYTNCSYVIEGNQVTIDMMGVIINLTINDYGFVCGNFMGVEVTFVFEDELKDSTKM